MYILYVDESGNETDPKDRHFVLAGLAIFERQTFYLSKSLDDLQNALLPGYEPIPYHAADINSGDKFWRKVPEATRARVLAGIGAAITQVRGRGLALIAAVVEKNASLYGDNAVKRATEELCHRFDILLMRHHHEARKAQRGLIVFSEGRLDARAKLWVHGFRTFGTQWGILRNLSDIPYFAPMKETRLLQAADFVAYSAFQLYERREPRFIRQLLPRFCEKDGVLHGLAHITASRTLCDCPGCASRNRPGDFGPWIR
jgi:hypothetical protein